MDEREGRGRKLASTKVMAVLVGEMEVELRVGVTDSSISISRVIGVSHWRGFILVRVGMKLLAIEKSLETRAMLLCFTFRTCAKGRASSLEGLLARAEGGLDCGKPLAVPSSTSYPLPPPLPPLPPLLHPPPFTTGGHKHPERILVFP